MKLALFLFFSFANDMVIIFTTLLGALGNNQLFLEHLLHYNTNCNIVSNFYIIHIRGSIEIQNLFFIADCLYYSK